MSASWLRGVAHGDDVSVAFLKIDVEGSTGLRSAYPPEVVTRLMDRYRGLVETAMRGVDALPNPPHWMGDGAAFVTGVDGAVAAMTQAALGLLRDLRTLPDGEIHVRLGIGFATVPWRDQVGTIKATELDFAGHLEHVCPKDGVLLTEEAYLAIEDEALRDQLTYFGMRADDRCPAFVAPITRRRTEAKHADELVPEAQDHYRHRLALMRVYDHPSFRLVRFIGVRQFERVGGVDLLAVYQPPQVRRWAEDRDMSRLAYQVDPELQPIDNELRRELSVYREQPGPPEDFATVFGRSHCLVVLGDPGAGKSTLLRHLVLVTRRGRHATRRAFGVDATLLPFHFSIGRLAGLIRSAGNRPPLAILAKYYEGLGAGDPLPVLEESVRDGTALLLFDGLDEVPSGFDRQTVGGFLEQVATSMIGVRIVLTSRIVGYLAPILPRSATYVLEPLADEAAKSLVQAFYLAFYALDHRQRPSEAAERATTEATQLITALSARPELKHFRENPLLLTLAALVHTQPGELPRFRARLYDVAVRTLIEVRSTARLAAPPIEPVRPIDYDSEGLAIFPALALELHTNRAGGIIPEADLIDFIAERLPYGSGGTPSERRVAAKDLLQRVATGGSILVEHGPRQWGFLHRTLQEYLAAKAIAGDDDLRTALWHDHLYDPDFEEVWRLLAGELGVVQQRPPAAAKLIEAILADSDWVFSDYFRKNVLLAGKCYIDTNISDRELSERMVKLVIDTVLDAKTPWPHAVLREFLSEWSPLPEAKRLHEAFVEALNQFESVPRATTAIAALALPEAIPVLRRTFGETDRPNWHLDHVAGALGELKVPEAVPEIIRFVERSGHNFAAWLALGRIGGPTASQYLQSHLTESPFAAFAIAELRDEEALVSFLLSPSSRASESALHGLVRSNAQAVVPSLCGLFESVESRRTVIALVLLSLGAEERIPELVSASLQDDLVALYPPSPERFGRYQELIREFEKGLTADSEKVRGRAAMVLASYGIKEVTAEVYRVAEESKSTWPTGPRAVALLGELGFAPAIPLLFRLLGGERDEWMRLAAAAALYRLGHREGVKVLLEAASPAAAIYAGEFRLLASMKAREALEELLRRLTQLQQHLDADAVWELSLLEPYRAQSELGE